jgi:hypothetical protein
MARRSVVLLVVAAAGLALVQPAATKDGVRATLTSAIPSHASAGMHIVVAFTLRDPDGRPFNAERVFVKLICPTRDASSIAFASLGSHADGRYRVVAIAPAGGLGSIRIGLRGSTDVYFPITNNPLAKSH